MVDIGEKTASDRMAAPALAALQRGELAMGMH